MNYLWSWGIWVKFCIVLSSGSGSNPGVYARELMEHCGKIVSNSSGISILKPVEVLHRIVAEAQSPGSSTILLAHFDGQVYNMILPFILMDQHYNSKLEINVNCDSSILPATRKLLIPLVVNIGCRKFLISCLVLFIFCFLLKLVFCYYSTWRMHMCMMTAH